MKAILLALVLVAALAGYASADPITMTFTDTGSSLGGGNTVSVGGQTVTNAPFTITVVSDTNNRITNPPSLGAFAGFTLNSIRASISIAELGTFDFITPTRVTLIAPPNVVGGTVVFARTNNLDIYGGVSTVALGMWDMLSSIGPQTESAETRFGNTNPAGSGGPVLTSGGVLVFNTPQRPVTDNVAGFQAMVGSGDGGGPVASTAEPGTLAFVGSGLAFLVASAVRRRGR